MVITTSNKRTWGNISVEKIAWTRASLWADIDLWKCEETLEKSLQINRVAFVLMFSMCCVNHQTCSSRDSSWSHSQLTLFANYTWTLQHNNSQAPFINCKIILRLHLLSQWIFLLAVMLLFFRKVLRFSTKFLFIFFGGGGGKMYNLTKIS